MKISEFLTVPEIAEAAKLSRNTIYGWIYSGHLPAYKFGKAVRIKKKDWEEFAKKKYVRANLEQKPYLSTNDIGILLGVHPHTVWTWIAQGKLKAYQIDKVLRIKREDFDAFIETYRPYKRNGRWHLRWYRKKPPDTLD